MSKNRYVKLAAAVIIGITLYFAAKRTTVSQKAYAQVRVQPFVLELQGYAYEPGGKSDLFLQKTVARRGDGTTAFIANAGPVSSGHVTRKIIAMGGIKTTLFDQLAAKTSFSLTREQIAGFKDQLENPPANCVIGSKEKFIRTESYMDQLVNVIGEQVDGTDRRTVWRAPALACESLSWQVERKQGDEPYRLLTLVKPSSLVLREPDPRYFDPGSSYTELKPTEIYKRFTESTKVPTDSGTAKQMELLDREYEKAHSAVR